jgi:hypothetical protein
LLERDIGQVSRKGIFVTFIVHASRGEDVAVTIRLSVVVAIAKGRSLLDAGWQVFITGPDGVRYYPTEFDKLLLGPALRSTPTSPGVAWTQQQWRRRGSVRRNIRRLDS